MLKSKQDEDIENILKSIEDSIKNGKNITHIKTIKPSPSINSNRQKANKILTIVRKLTLSSFRLPSGLRTIDKRRRKENPLKKYNK